MSIKIKPWSNIHNQRYSDDGKGRYVVGNLISRAKELPIKEMPMEHLGLYGICIDAGDSMMGFVRHMKGVMDADLQYPIILDEDGYIMDGRHRVAKALLEGKETIKYVRFEETPDPDYYVD